MTLFTLKYAPKNSDQVFGQDKAVSELKDFITNYKTKRNKAASLLDDRSRKNFFRVRIGQGDELRYPGIELF